MLQKVWLTITLLKYKPEQIIRSLVHINALNTNTGKLVAMKIRLNKNSNKSLLYLCKAEL